MNNIDLQRDITKEKPLTTNKGRENTEKQFRQLECTVALFDSEGSS